VVRLGLHLLARAARHAPGAHHDSGPEADLYLEGHDQHRGWFHSSLLLACAIFGRAPYRGLLTHGFTVDGQGRKMSKSLGNGVDPQEVSKKLGAEIIRLWVASTDYSGDIAGDDKILARVVDAYRRIRNTLRFLLANTSDFDPPPTPCPPSRCWRSTATLARAAQLQAEILAHYEVYEFHPVVAKLQVYCSEDLGAFYLDVLKDRLYTTAPKSLARRSPRPRCGRSPRPCCAGWRPSCLHRRGGLEGRGTRIHLPRDLLELRRRRRACWPSGRIRAAATGQQGDRSPARGRPWASLQAEVSSPRPGAARCGPAAKPGRRPEVRLHHLGRAPGVAPPSPAPASAPRSRQVRALLALPRTWAQPQHPTLCGRCDSNLHGAGESRSA
jgi:isoleucyl-tRNA synthetase